MITLPTPTQERRALSVAPGLRLTLMRGFELRVDGRTVPVAMSSQRVLAFLALHDRSLPRSYVAETLWADVGDSRAAGNLRSALWRLGELGRQTVWAIGRQLQLAADMAVDVQEADHAAARLAAGRVASGEAPDRSLFEGELLPGWCEDWVSDRREQCRQRGLHALEQLCEVLTAEGRYCQAVQAGMAAVAGDPLRESAQRALIAAHLAEGNAGEAVRQFERFERVLRYELGLAPSEPLRMLITSL
jgi:DNA-binding SARP family transcriptional activator